MSKFLSYVKKFSAMLFLSLVVSISLFNKNILAIDPAKLTPGNNELIYTDSAQPKVLYELSTDKKSFNAIVGDEGATVYSKVSYTGDGNKELTLPVTSISVGNSGVSNFTLNLVGLKNDKVKIIPSEYGDLTVTLNYNGNLSQSEARKIFEGTDMTFSMSLGRINSLITKRYSSSGAESSESIIESSPKSSEISSSAYNEGIYSSPRYSVDKAPETPSVAEAYQSDDNYKIPQYLLDLTSSKDIYESVQKELEKELSAYKAKYPWVDLNIGAGPFTRRDYLKKILEQLSEEQRNAYNYEAGKILYEKIMERISGDYNKWLSEHPNATESRKEKKKNDLFVKQYNSFYFDEDRDLIDDYLETLEKSSSTDLKAQKPKYYVDENGKTSTEITEYGMIWLKETSDGTSAWYGIDNSDGTFKIGSKFWVKWLSPKIDREEFKEYYNKLDEEHKNKVDNNNLWIFLTGVTDPDGNEYTNFYGNLNYYIQIGDDWDKDDINVVFISGKKDSVLDVSYVNLECPDGKDEFAKVVMKHFSPYAVYDEKDEIKTSNVSKSAYIKTGESVSKLTFMFYISLFLVAFLNRKKYMIVDTSRIDFKGI